MSRPLGFKAAAAAIGFVLSFAIQAVSAANIPIVNPNFGGSGAPSLVGWTVKASASGAAHDFIYPTVGGALEGTTYYPNIAALNCWQTCGNSFNSISQQINGLVTGNCKIAVLYR